MTATLPELSIAAFKGMRYNTDALSPESVVTPPYDKISEDKRSLYTAGSPYSIVRLILPTAQEDLDKYASASQLLLQWIHEGILIQEKKDSLYIYKQDYTVGKTTYTRHALIANVGVSPYEDGIIHRHEKTFSKYKNDRFQLSKACEAFFGQIFMIYQDQKTMIHTEIIPAAKKLFSIDLDDITHTLFVVDEPEAITRCTQYFTDKKLVIADGHHRYETSLALSTDPVIGPLMQKRRMMTLVNTKEAYPILPTHRLVSLKEPLHMETFIQRAYEKGYIVTAIDAADTPRNTISSITACLKTAESTNKTIFCMAASGIAAAYSITRENLSPDSSDKPIPIDILHKDIIREILGINDADPDSITYHKDIDLCIEEILTSPNKAAFLVNPTDIEDVMRVALSGNVMPRKSTDFYPKLYTGLVFQKL